jgi:hypothetical protein
MSDNGRHRPYRRRRPHSAADLSPGIPNNRARHRRQRWVGITVTAVVVAFLFAGWTFAMWRIVNRADPVTDTSPTVGYYGDGTELDVENLLAQLDDVHIAAGDTDDPSRAAALRAQERSIATRACIQILKIGTPGPGVASWRAANCVGAGLAPGSIYG